MMQMDQTRPAMTVSRSRLRSTTEEPDRLEYSEPPNIDDRPPPLPRCSNTRTISIRLAMIRTIDSNVIIIWFGGLARISAPAPDWRAGATRIPALPRQPIAQAVTGPSRRRAAGRCDADPGELRPVQAGAADQGAVDVRLGDDLPGRGRFDRAAVEDPHAAGQLGVVQLGEPAAHRRTHLL